MTEERAKKSKFAVFAENSFRKARLRPFRRRRGSKTFAVASVSPRRVRRFPTFRLEERFLCRC
jgi:hypothetical protein